MLWFPALFHWIQPGLCIWTLPGGLQHPMHPSWIGNLLSYRESPPKILFKNSSCPPILTCFQIPFFLLFSLHYTLLIWQLFQLLNRPLPPFFQLFQNLDFSFTVVLRLSFHHQVFQYLGGPLAQPHVASENTSNSSFINFQQSSTLVI